MSGEITGSFIDRMAAEARRGRLSRRDFTRFAIAAGLSTSFVTNAWNSKVAMAAPQRGGTFRLGSHDGNTSDTHDPGTYLSFSIIQLAHTYRSYLTQINSDNTLGGDLATGWSASDDATEWTFEIHSGASFHSGKPVTADDVIASMNHHRGRDSTSAARALLSDVDDIVKNGEHSITFKLASGNADMPWLMTDYHLAIVPGNDDGSANWQSGDGSGPYKIVDNEFGVRTLLERHDGWHGEGAYFDSVELTVLNDPNARQTALVTGDVDAITQIELRTLSLLERDPSIEIDNVPSGSTLTMPMHCNQEPFDNVDVRNALKLAINREDIIEKIAFGAAVPGNDFHISPNMPYHPGDAIPQREYDPDQARSLLRRAGMEDLIVNLSVADSVYSGAVDFCVLYSEHAKEAGITINVVREPNDGYYSDVWLQKPFCLVQWGARPTPDVMLSLAYKDDAAWNESYWQNERFNELLRAAKAELDDTVRAAQYLEMCQLARDDGGTIIPMFANYVYARRSNVKHSGELAASWQIDGARGCSRWWFEN